MPLNSGESINQGIVTDADGRQVVASSPGVTSVGDGRTVVTTAGTRVALAASTAVKSVCVTAETDNTGVVVVGGSTCVAALATRRGLPLNAGDSATFYVDNLADLSLDSTVNGDGVTYVYVA